MTESAPAAPCVSVAEAGAFVVWPSAARAEVSAPALPAAAIDAGASFSPADLTRRGPHKYFIGGAYSGERTASRVGTVRQLETEVDFLCRRFTGRSGGAVGDVTAVVGAAALVFWSAGRAQKRRDQVPGLLALVREAAERGPHLRLFMAAGRLLLILICAEQTPQTYHPRDIASAVREQRAEQRALAGKFESELAIWCRHINQG